MDRSIQKSISQSIKASQSIDRWIDPSRNQSKQANQLTDGSIHPEINQSINQSKQANQLTDGSIHPVINQSIKQLIYLFQGKYAALRYEPKMVWPIFYEIYSADFDDIIFADGIFTPSVGLVLHGAISCKAMLCMYVQYRVLLMSFPVIDNAPQLFKFKIVLDQFWGSPVYWS